MSTKDRLTVMVVDDMSVSRALIIQSLDDLGIRKVDYCVDGASAFKRLASQPVHLVISDYNMPGANGLQLLSGLRKYKTTQKIGFILITGMATAQIVDQGNELGMNNYLKKPFSTKD
ncbi:MAG: response regulator, partial [Pseudomonadota bacterium]